MGKAKESLAEDFSLTMNEVEEQAMECRSGPYTIFIDRDGRLEVYTVSDLAQPDTTTDGSISNKIRINDADKTTDGSISRQDAIRTAAPYDSSRKMQDALEGLPQQARTCPAIRKTGKNDPLVVQLIESKEV